MDPRIASELLAVNRRFYSEFGDSFAATRRRIQPGVSRILASIPSDIPSDWLDLGCGSGALGQIWAGQQRSGSYTGLDFSGPLLREAERVTDGLSDEKLTLRYLPGDLMDPLWPERLDGMRYDGVLAFASLHHIPGRENHLRIFRQIRDLLKNDGTLIFSVWQFQNSPKLMQRVQPWSLAGLDETQTDPGDKLLDWRSVDPGEEKRQALRYVHLFTENELDGLLCDSGFSLKERFYSDGATGDLSMYCCAVKDGS